MVELVREVTHN